METGSVCAHAILCAESTHDLRHLAAALARDGEAVWDDLAGGREAQEGLYRALLAASRRKRKTKRRRQTKELREAVNSVFGCPPEKRRTSRDIQAFTDGSCKASTGPGGWAAVMLVDGETREISGHEAETTSSRMELRAAIEPGATIQVTTDSKSLRDGITKWIGRWRQNEWRSASGSEIKSTDLWTRLEAHELWH